MTFACLSSLIVRNPMDRRHFHLFNYQPPPTWAVFSISASTQQSTFGIRVERHRQKKKKNTTNYSLVTSKSTMTRKRSVRLADYHPGSFPVTYDSAENGILGKSIALPSDMNNWLVKILYRSQICPERRKIPFDQARRGVLQNKHH
ncbi:hypothetical protein T10_557 [Trichinella papuae]|uniref:Uncharacterized protein n=1 Tax=Trichinella papuae TaxID=268474 RepID=A0A0V1MTH1_9BILA|nr:hypothetical protein T10_557 [Trichinella papuae]